MYRRCRMTGLLHPSDEQYDPADYFPRHALVDASRLSPLDWVRQRRVDAAHAKAAHQMESLGRDWRVVDLQETGGKPMSFLAFGPGGVFAVTVKDHGRSKVSFAGDVVQIDGRRPRYVAEARDNAKL